MRSWQLPQLARWDEEQARRSGGVRHWEIAAAAECRGGKVTRYRLTTRLRLKLAARMTRA